MKKISKLSAVILALIMIVGMFSLAASADSGPEADLLYAHYHLYYNGNGSTSGFQSDGASYSEWQKATVKNQGSLLKTGYTFKNWNTAADGSGDTYKPGDKIDFITGKHWGRHGWEYDYGNKTLYAQWTINQYTMTFQSEGGSDVSPVTQDYNTTVAKPADPTKTGHTFAGWYACPGGTGSAVAFPYTLTDNVTVYAQWTINPYTMTFNSEGGSAVAPVTQNYNTTVAKPADPTKEGYTFAGWYSNAGGTGSAVGFPYTLTDNVTVYAKWNINFYTMVFDSEGGSSVDPVTQAYDTKIAAPQPPTRFGFTFDGWYTGSLGIGAKIVFPYTIKKSITVHAKWNANTYTLKFDSEGGSAVASQSRPYGEYVNAPANPTKDGYTFDGWYLGDNGTGSKAVFPYNVVGNATVYAKWVKIAVVTEVSVPTTSITPAVSSTPAIISSTPTPTSVPAMGEQGIDATSITIIILSALMISGLAVIGLKKLSSER